MFEKLMNPKNRAEMRRNITIKWRRFKWWFKTVGIWWLVYAAIGAAGLFIGVIIGIFMSLSLLVGA